MTSIRALILLLVTSLLFACSTTYKAPISDRTIKTGSFHRVQKGETLYSIAWSYGLDYRQLKAWNRIGKKYAIYPGQTLRLKPPKKVSSAKVKKPQKTNNKKATKNSQPRSTTQSKKTKRSVKTVSKKPVAVHRWLWPTRGRVIRGFSKKESGKKGIAISGRSGQRVIASAAGKVVYSGEGLLRYGKLIIIKHNNTYLSAYAHNRRLLVKEGSLVKQGQPIAELGRSGTDRNMLHFEIRKNGKPINPLYFLSKK